MSGEDNIYFDIATSHNDAAETQLDRFIKEVGADRILYATDAQLMHPAWTLGKIAGINLSDNELKKIFMMNALRAFPKLKN